MIVDALSCGAIMVSVPIRGLFNLTNGNIGKRYFQVAKWVSVPIRGLFNLTKECTNLEIKIIAKKVSVPIRGLFNLTISF